MQGAAAHQQGTVWQARQAELGRVGQAGWGPGRLQGARFAVLPELAAGVTCRVTGRVTCRVTCRVTGRVAAGVTCWVMTGRDGGPDFGC